MSVSELKELRAPLVSSDRAGYYSVLAFCKFVRDNHIRDEQSLVSKNGLRVLKSNFSSLGNEGACRRCRESIGRRGLSEIEWGGGEESEY